MCPGKEKETKYGKKNPLILSVVHSLFIYGFKKSLRTGTEQTEIHGLDVVGNCLRISRVEMR